MVSERQDEIDRKKLSSCRMLNAAENYNSMVYSNGDYDGNCFFSSIIKLLPEKAWDTNTLTKHLIEDKEVCGE